MVNIPFNPNQWLIIEFAYRDNNPGDTRKKLPIRCVADWFATWIFSSRRLD